MVKHYCWNCERHQYTEKIGRKEGGGWFSVCSVCSKRITSKKEMYETALKRKRAQVSRLTKERNIVKKAKYLRKKIKEVKVPIPPTPKGAGILGTFL